MKHFTALLVATASCLHVSLSSIKTKPDEDVLNQKRADISWQHPGIFNNQSQLEYVSARLAAQEQPWLSAYNTMLSEALMSSSRTPSPVPTVECGPYSNPNVSCTDETSDAVAAYGHALAWVLTSDHAHTAQAMQFTNSWASVVQGHTNSNARLQAGWAASMWTHAAELIRYSNAGWSTADISQFEAMLVNAYLPSLIGPQAILQAGNWQLVMMEAAMNIAVFTENQTLWDQSMDIFMQRLPAYVYLQSGGDYPVALPGSGYTTRDRIEEYWFVQDVWNYDGFALETCRDLQHTGYGLASISHVAQTARIQGQNLFLGDTGTRLQAALGFHSRLMLQGVPDNVCNGSVKSTVLGIIEPGYNALALGYRRDMPLTQNYTVGVRPSNNNRLLVAYETLTHARADF